MGAIDRRVLGVLAEKAKTTPDIYPMSLNAICTGCNQKSNRDPLMQLEPDDAQESLERLRQLGAVGMVEGYGRVTKYRHYLYEWLGVEKLELSVMIEVLLRRKPRGNFAAASRGWTRFPICRRCVCCWHRLSAKGLVIPLTPEGRGHVVSHGLYTPRELEHLRAQYSHVQPAAFSREDGPAAPLSTGGTGSAGAAGSPASHRVAYENTQRRPIPAARRLGRQ